MLAAALQRSEKKHAACSPTQRLAWARAGEATRARPKSSIQLFYEMSCSSVSCLG